MKFERKVYNYYWPKLALSNARLANYSKILHVYRNSTVIKCYMQIMYNYIFKTESLHQVKNDLIICTLYVSAVVYASICVYMLCA